MKKTSKAAAAITTAAPDLVMTERQRAMNDLAMRIWEGQSVSLPLGDRVRRIKAALIDREYGDELEALFLPVENFKAYL